LQRRLNGKVALITGASKGIGKSIALAYAKEGANLILTARTAHLLEQVASEARKNSQIKAVTVPGDVSRAQDVRKVVETAMKSFGRIDVLLNNAGIPGSANSLEQTTETELDNLFQVNVKGPFLVTKEVLPYMRKQASGNIINMSSGAGEKKPLNIPVRSISYSVTKFALEGFNYSLAGKLLGTGINVNAIRPGVIKTTIHANTPPEILREMEKRSGFQEPEVVNPVAVYLASLRPGELTGTSIRASEWNKEHPKYLV
jgi:3-oxoacyl-[acyl-carrier protein] reductase